MDVIDLRASDDDDADGDATGDGGAGAPPAGMRYAVCITGQGATTGLPPTTALEHAQDAIVDDALREGEKQQVLVQAFKIPVTRENMRRLAPVPPGILSWADARALYMQDETINFYLALLQAQNAAARARAVDAAGGGVPPRVHILPTHLYSKLTERGEYQYKRVARWTENPQVDLFAMELVLVPIHIGWHWTLGVAYMQTNTARIEYYDSRHITGTSGTDQIEILRRYLVDEALDKKPGEPDIATKWAHAALVPKRRTVPQQRNGVDCGVFMCMFCTYLAQQRAIDFTRADMPHFRRLICLSIATAKPPPECFDAVRPAGAAGAGAAAGAAADGDDAMQRGDDDVAEGPAPAFDTRPLQWAGTSEAPAAAART